jgi:hypothetical protein
MTSQHVFLSRPTSVDRHQQSLCRRMVVALEGQDLKPRTLGVTDYPSKAPLGEVLRLMETCDGAIILGLRQLRIQSGLEKENTDNETEVKGLLLPTAWNQIEAGMAVALGLPLLIIREEGVSSGVFDIGSSDQFVHQAEMSPQWTRSAKFMDPFRRWVTDVQARQG